MAPNDPIKGLAHKFAEAKSEGERLKAVEEESRRLILEFKREAIERALIRVVERVLGACWERITPWNCKACGKRWASK